MIKGTDPNIVEELVIKMGLKRRSAAKRAASKREQPVFSEI